MANEKRDRAESPQGGDESAYESNGVPEPGSQEEKPDLGFHPIRIKGEPLSETISANGGSGLIKA